MPIDSLSSGNTSGKSPEGVNITEIVEVQNSLATSIESRGNTRDIYDEMMFDVLQELKIITISLGLLRNTPSNPELLDEFNSIRTHLIEAITKLIYVVRSAYPDSDFGKYPIEMLNSSLYQSILSACTLYIEWRKSGIDTVQAVVRHYLKDKIPPSSSENK